MKKILFLILIALSTVFASENCNYAAETMLHSIHGECKTIAHNEWHCIDSTKYGNISHFVSYFQGVFEISRHAEIAGIEQKRYSEVQIFTDFCSFRSDHSHFMENHNDRTLAKYYKDMFVETYIR